MRIVLICAAGIVSGKEIMSLQLLYELKKKGYECFCIVSSWGSNEFKQRLSDMDIPFVSMRIGFISKTFKWSAMRMTIEQVLYLPGLWSRYNSVIRKFKPEAVIHTNFHHLFLLYPVIGQRSRNYYWSHEIVGSSSFYLNLFKLFKRKIDLFIGVSNAVSDSMKRLIGDDKVMSIRNGVNIPETISAFGNREEIVFAIVGQVSSNKGHELLFRALKSQIGRTRFRLKIVGDGLPDFEQYLHKLSDELSLTPYVEWLGFIKDHDKIYSGVDWIVVPTLNPEPLGLIVMEAGVRGIPAIGSNGGGIRELIADGENGFLFAAGNQSALETAIQRAIDLKDLAELREKTIHIARNNFGIDKFASDFDSILKERIR